MRLTRNGKIVVFGLIIMIIVSVGIKVVYDGSEKKEPEVTVKETSKLVLENQKIKSVYVDSISKDKSSKEDVIEKIKLDKDFKIEDYSLGEEQVFEKHMVLEGPAEKEILSSKTGDAVTHYAYSMLLTGDVVEVTNQETKEKYYRVENARITYTKTPFVLLSDENSVRLANKAGNDEKIMNLQEFIAALESIEKRKSVISW